MERALPSPTADELLAQLGWVRSLARSLIGDPGRADDIAQDATLLALERLPEDARSGSAQRAWLAGVIRRLAHGSRRAEARRKAREAYAARPEAQSSSSEVVERADMHQRLVRAVLALDEPYRSAVLLRHLDGLAAPAIAERTGVAPATVRQRISRGLAQLREQLDDEPGGRRAWVPALTGLATAAAPGPTGQATFLGVTWSSTRLAAGLLVASLAGAVGLAALLSRGEPATGGPEAATVTVAHEARAREDGASRVAPVEDGPRAVAAPPASPGDAGILITGTLRHVPYPGVPTPADSGIEVTASHGFPPEKVSAVTDDEGRFRIEVADPGERPLRTELHVAADATHRWFTARHRLQAGEREWSDVQLERCAHGRLAGRVLDLAGKPVAGMALEFSQATVTPGQVDGEPVRVETDEDGSFSIESYPGQGGFMGNRPLAEVQDDGWRLVSSGSPKRRPGGGWEPIELVVSTTGSLRLSCVDAEGTPVPAQVRLEVAASEREGQTSRFGQLRLRSETDELGQIHFEDAWAGRRLALMVHREKTSFRVERFAGDRALLLPDADDARGAPIVIPTGGELALTLVLGPWLTVRGRVLRPGGEPVAEAWVSLDERIAPDWRRGQTEGACRTDARGGFEWTTRLPLTGAALRVVASDAAPGGPATWSSPWNAAAVAETILVNDFEQAGGNVREVELTLAPTLTISGRVVAADGEPVHTSIRAVPEGASLVAVGETVRSQALRSEDDGTFSVPTLLPGRYDLVVDVPGHSFFTSSFVRQRFAGIEAGAADLELSLDETAGVQVTVHAVPPGGRTLSRTGVTIAKIHPREDVPLDARTPASRERFHDRSGWVPAATLALGSGQAFSRNEVAFFEGLYTGGDGDEVRLPPLEEGLYWLGVRAVDEDGRSLHPTGTGYLNLVAGSYRFDFIVDETGDLPGNARGPHGAQELHVCLVDDSGAPIHLRVGDRVQPLVPIGSGGDFELRAVPVGTFEAWFGTRADLEAHRPLLRTDVVIRPGDNPPLTVDLQ